MQAAHDEQSQMSGKGRMSLTLEKGLLLLSLFDVDHPNWSLRELREETGLSKSTVLRLVKTLESHNYLCCDPRDGRYHLGGAIVRAAYATSLRSELVFATDAQLRRLSRATPDTNGSVCGSDATTLPTDFDTGVLNAAYANLFHSDLIATADPFMQELCKTTTETVDLTLETDQGVLLVASAVTSRMVRPYTPVGRVFPGLTIAAGKIFLAFKPESEWDEALDRPLVSKTEHTIVDPEKLREQMEQIRRDGVGFDFQEWSLEMGSVAAPVFGVDGHVRACLAVVVPVERFGPKKRKEHASAVRRVAREVSLALGAPKYRVEL